MIRDLVVNLTGNNDGFKRSIKQSESLLAGMATNARIVMGGITTVLTGLAVAGGSLAATFALVQSRLTALADLADRAERAGVGAGWLRSMEFAADMAGVSADKLGASMSKLTMQIGKARAGSEPVQEAFAKLGLNLQQLQSMSTEQVFAAIAERLSKMPDPADRTALAMEIFGKSAAELIPLLNQGAEGLAELVKEAENLGLALTDEEIKAAAEADDAIQKLTKSFGALTDKLAIDFAPGITSAVDDILTMTKAIGDLDASLMDWSTTISNAPIQIGTELIDDTMMGGLGSSILGGSLTEGGLQSDLTYRLGGVFGGIRAEEELAEQKKIVAQQIRDLKVKADEEKKLNEQIAQEKVAAEEKARQDAIANRLDMMTAGNTGVQFDFMGQVMAGQVTDLLDEMDRRAESERLTLDGSINSIVERPAAQQAGFAASAEKGSAEAFSAINQAMAERDRAQRSLQQRALEAQEVAAEALQVIQTKLLGAPTLAVIPQFGGL